MSAHPLRVLPSLALAIACLCLSACAPKPIYKAGSNATSANAAAVAREPERYAGQSVIWGGRVVQVKNLADHSEIEILGYPMDASQRPQPNDAGSGRFIAVLPGYVEALNYPDGALITVSGVLAGSRAGKVGEADYVFPLVRVSQSHVWTAQELRSGHPNISFGVGVGVIR